MINSRISLCSLLALLMHQLLFANPIQLEFSFGKKRTKEAIVVHKALPYDRSSGYGFEFGTEKAVSFVKQRDGNSLYAHTPFYFSIQVPEGNYLVTVGYRGTKDSVYHSTVRSESRRLHLERVPIAKDEIVKKSFVVHIKDAQIDKGHAVRLKKPREESKLDWDDKLTLEFQQTNQIEYIRITAIDKVKTVFLAGNSTVVNQEDEPWASWGQMIPRFFDSHIAIANHAESGLALSSFLSSNRLEKILSIAKPGDYLFIEFGHNDQKEKGDKAGAFHGYTERLRFFVQQFRTKGGIPVILTSTARRAFDERGNLQYTLGDYPTAAREVAKELQVPLIDLNSMTRIFYQTLGVENSKRALVHYPANTFPNQPQPLQDNTHFNTYGAYQIAKMVVQGIRNNELDIEKHIIDFTNYNPAYPDPFERWNWPPSIKTSGVKPDGN